jgi:WD40 repeat protein
MKIGGGRQDSLVGPGGKVLLALREYEPSRPSLRKETRLWDLFTGQPIGEPLAIEGRLGPTAFSPDGKVLAVASRRGSGPAEQVDVRLWDAAKARVIGAPLPHARPVAFLGFSPDSRLLLTAAGSEVRLWNAADSRSLGPALPQSGEVTRAAFSPDSRRMALLSGREIRLWDVGTRRPVGSSLLAGGPVRQLTFGRDGRLLQVATDAETRLWDVSRLSRLGPLQRVYDNEAAVAPVAFSPDGRAVLLEGHIDTGSFVEASRRVVRWDTSTGAAKETPRGARLLERPGPGGNPLVGESRPRAVLRLRDAATGKARGRAMVLFGEFLREAAFSPDGRRFLTRSRGDDPRDIRLRLWDAGTGRAIGEPKASNARRGDTLRPSSTERDGFNDRAFLTAQRDEGRDGIEYRAWETATGKALGPPIFQKNTGPVESSNSERLSIG